jgi:hypothetical protein
MFFYIIHQINHNLKKDDETEGSINARTLIFGGMLYIITHAIVSTPGNFLNFYNNYLWWMFLLDCCVMGYIYKSYFERSIPKEIIIFDNNEYDEKNHNYIKKENKDNDKKLDLDIEEEKSKIKEEINKISDLELVEKENKDDKKDDKKDEKMSEKKDIN